MGDSGKKILQVWREWCVDDDDLSRVKERMENPLFCRLEVCERCKWLIKGDDFVVDPKTMERETRYLCACDMGPLRYQNGAEFEKGFVPHECTNLGKQIEANLKEANLKKV